MQGNDEYSNSINRENYNSKKNKKSNVNVNGNAMKEDVSFELKAAYITANLMEGTNANVNVNDSGAISVEERIEKFIESLSEGDQNAIPDSLGKVIGSALLITSNTVGASMMVIPSLASGPGMVVSSGMIGFIYLIHLFSGLLLAEVAINQYESSSCDVPSSFKEFADVNFNSKIAGTSIALISIFVNMCVLSFDLTRGGDVLATEALAQFQTSNLFDAASESSDSAILAPLFGSDTFMNNIPHDLASNCGTTLAALGVMYMVSTQNSDTLSKVASVCCMTLFISFAGLVLPGLALIHDPISTFLNTPGLYDFGTPSFYNSLFEFAPIALMALVYQNIVPTIAKNLNYERKQIIPAIALGSFLPMLMFLSFIFVQIGSTGTGAAADASTGGLFMYGITVSSLIGSALACTISISQEVDIFFGRSNTNKNSKEEAKSSGVNDAFLSYEYDGKDGEDEMLKLVDVVNSEKQCLVNGDALNGSGFDLSSVALAITPPVLAGIYFSGGDCFTGALSLSGSYGTPLLYGVIPVLLALNQRNGSMERKQQQQEQSKGANNLNLFAEDVRDGTRQIAPGGIVGLGLFGTGSLALIVSHLVSDVSSLL